MTTLHNKRVYTSMQAHIPSPHLHRIFFYLTLCRIPATIATSDYFYWAADGCATK